MAIDPKKSKVTKNYKHGRPLMACRFAPNGKTVFTSSEDYSLQRWDFATGKRIKWEAHDSWVYSLAVLPNGTLISGGGDGRVILWDAGGEKPKALRQLDAHAGWVRGLNVAPGGKVFASAATDKIAKIWSAEGKLLRELKGHEADIYSAQFSPDGKKLLTGDLSGKVREWDVASGKPGRIFPATALHSYNKGQKVHYGGVREIAFAPDKKHVAFCGLHKASNPLGAVNEPLALRFDAGRPKPEKPVVSHAASGVRGVAWGCRYLSDGTLVACSGGSGGGYLLFWKPDGKQPLHKMKLRNTARGIDLHPDAGHLVTTHHDGYLRVTSLSGK